MSYDYRLMHLPSIRADTYVLVTSRGDSVAVRHYATALAKPTPHRIATLRDIEAEAKRSRAPILIEDPHSTNDSGYWWRRITAANQRARLAPATSHVPNRGRFVSHFGSPLATLTDWQALHPTLHWKPGYSAMELARAWHLAIGFPPAVASVLSAASFGPLTLERAIAECRTAVPGAGRPSHTDLMVEARDAAGWRVVVAVEGKVSESFGPVVRAWLDDVDRESSAPNKLERLRGLCDGLGLPMGPGTEALRYQLLHRTWAALSHAKTVAAHAAIVLVHSFAPLPDADNRVAFGEFLAAMGQARFAPDVVLPLGRRQGIDLHAAWVSDVPVSG